MRRPRRGIDIVANHASKHALAHMLPYAPPWAVGATLLPGAELAHHMWGLNPQVVPWATAGLTLAGTALTAVTWAAGRARGRFTRAHASVSVGAASAWFTSAAIVGAGAHPIIDLFGIGLPSLALSWNVRRMLRGDGDGDGWSDLAERVKLTGARVSHPKVDGARVTGQVQLVPGEQTVADLVSARDRIASGLGVPPTGVRFNADPDRADQAEIIVVPTDQLRRTIPWPGPSASGGSIAAPLVLGTYEHAAPVRLWLPGDHNEQRNLAHVLLMGMSGAGKSEGALVLATEVLTRSDAVLWVADPIKGEQTFGVAKNGIDWFATTHGDAKAMLKAVEQIVRARADWLGQRGYKQWEPGCGIPLLVVILEEAAAYVANSGVFTRVVQQARSTGVSVVVSMQRASYQNIPTDARAQLGAVLCFGVRGTDDAGFALSDTVLDSGANPAAWGAKRPGYAYLEAPGVPEENWPTPLRTFQITPEQITATIDAHARVRAELDPVTIDAAGPAYTNRTRRAVPIDITEPVQQQTAPIRPDANPAPDPEEFEEVTAELLDTDDELEPVPVPDNPEPGLLDTVDTEQEIPDNDEPRWQFVNVPTAGRELTTSEAQAMLAQYLDGLAEAGQTTVRPADLAELRPKLTRSRTWLSRELARLCAEGTLVETGDPGVYRLPARAHAA
ncbi:MAG TPA: hypothetical protein VIS06_13290 [Mycobacteriales bacterium]